MSSVSVIIPNYNHAPYLPRRIESILAQSRGDFELLILDDCSPDNSRDVIEGYETDPRVRVEFSERNSGNSYLQWCKGIEHTTGEYIWIAESDDFADPRFLERLSLVLDKEPQAGLAFCETVIVDEAGDRIGRHLDLTVKRRSKYGDFEMFDHEFTMDGRDYIRAHMLPWNTIPNASGVLFRRSALEGIGGPVTSMRLCGDWLTYCKILLSWKVAHVPECLNFFRRHAVTVRSTAHAEVVAQEWLHVARQVEQDLGPLPRRVWGQLERFAANALLHAERGPSGHIAFKRVPSALVRAAQLSPSLVWPTAAMLLRETASNFASTSGRMLKGSPD